MLDATSILTWALQIFALFIAFSVQGAMWRGAQDRNNNGWVVALTWAVACTALINGLHELHELHHQPTPDPQA